jgi:hypothetical protein
MGVRLLASLSCVVTNSFCSEPLTDPAYIILSKNLSVPIDQPPMTPAYDPAAAAALRFMRGSAVTVPQTWLLSSSYIALHQCLEEMVAQFQSQYPTIVVDIPLLQRLVRAAENVRTEIIVPLVQAGRVQRILGEFLASIIQDRLVKAIEAYFDAIVEYLKSTDIFDPIRSAITANLGPYLHAWLAMYQRLRLPYPFHGRGYLDLLTHVAKFDPLYTQNDEENIWTISIDPSAPYYYSPPFILDHDDLTIDDYFTPVIEDIQRHVVGHTWATSPENIVRLIHTRLRLMVMTYNMRQHSWPEISTHIKASLVFLRTHKDEISIELFCESTRDIWTTLFMAITLWAEEGGFPYLLDIFRICGQQYLSVSDRVLIVLPAILGTPELSRFRTVLNVGTPPSLLIHELRQGVQFHSMAATEISLSSYLTQFIRAATMTSGFRTTDPQSHQLLGNFVALLVLEGDPKGILETLIQRGITRNFYFDSEFVKRGFCHVLNCLAFDVLFQDSDLIHVLQFLRSQHVLDGDRERRSRLRPSAPLDDFILSIFAEAIGDI